MHKNSHKWDQTSDAIISNFVIFFRKKNIHQELNLQHNHENEFEKNVTSKKIQILFIGMLQIQIYDCTNTWEGRDVDDWRVMTVNRWELRREGQEGRAGLVAWERQRVGRGGED